MSWSFYATGRAAAVAAAARKAKETGICIAPEEGYRLAALESIATMSESLVGYNGAAAVVQVGASGSMSKDGDTVKSHTMALEFKPLASFLE